MKISLFQGVIMGVFGLAALIGLFVFATHTSTSVNNPGATGPVVIWGTLSKADMQSALTTIAQTEPSFKDVSYIQKDSATLSSDIAAAIATGNAPDLILASQEHLQSLVKYLEPIPLTMLSASDFTNTFLREGGLLVTPERSGFYGLPFLVDPLVLFSNRALLASHGIAKPPTTWEALTGLVPAVAELTPTKQITRGLIALGTYENVHNARAILSALFLQAGVPLSSYSGGVLKSDVRGDASSSGLPGQAVLSFYTQFADPSKVSYTWNASLEDSRRAFLTGNLALYIGYASEARLMASTNPNLDFLVTALPQPATAKIKSTYGLMYGLMIPRGAKNASGAYTVAALLTNPDKQAALSVATGLAPATLNQLSVRPVDPTSAVTYAEALYSSGWLSPAPALTDAVFSGMITGVITGRVDATSAITSGENLLNSYLQK